MIILERFINSVCECLLTSLSETYITVSIYAVITSGVVTDYNPLPHRLYEKHKWPLPKANFLEPSLTVLGYSMHMVLKRTRVVCKSSPLVRSSLLCEAVTVNR